MGTKTRILVDLRLDGQYYKPDQVVDFPAAVAKALAEAGQVDPNKEAVNYCIRELGAEIITHAVPVADAAAAAAAAKAAAITELEFKIANVPAGDKPALEAELAALKAE